jgi:hypothetical protein
MQDGEKYFKLAQLHVGVTGCPIIVRVEHANPIRHVEKLEAYKGLWVVMDQDGGKADVDYINKDEEDVTAWGGKLRVGQVVIMEDFRVVDQKSLR